ncbi:MAG: hypothetical protein H0X70_04115 [Segetibacter sp.]|nr:hypothetical protein [Segetibacter sp.]
MVRSDLLPTNRLNELAGLLAQATKGSNNGTNLKTSIGIARYEGSPAQKQDND